MYCTYCCRILGLYVGMVLVVGQFVRGFTSGAAYTIMFDELPDVNRLMKLCKDLYFVREHEELELEEDLFSRLIYLYRSAHPAPGNYWPRRPLAVAATTNLNPHNSFFMI